jgi:putative oxidoreductase
MELNMNRANDALLLTRPPADGGAVSPFGHRQAMNFAPFAQSLADKGLPYAEVWAYAAVAAEILGPIALILGALPTYTALLLLVFVVAATGISHRFWEFADAGARRGQEISFYKNVGIVAGLLFYLASGAGSWSVAGLMSRKPSSRPTSILRRNLPGPRHNEW